MTRKSQIGKSGFLAYPDLCGVVYEILGQEPSHTTNRCRKTRYLRKERSADKHARSKDKYPSLIASAI
jgi:hypothetical protein